MLNLSLWDCGLFVGLAAKINSIIVWPYSHNRLRPGILLERWPAELLRILIADNRALVTHITLSAMPKALRTQFRPRLHNGLHLFSNNVCRYLLFHQTVVVKFGGASCWRNSNGRKRVNCSSQVDLLQPNR